jgi:hypothetical protein
VKQELQVLHIKLHPRVKGGGGEKGRREKGRREEEGGVCV